MTEPAAPEVHAALASPVRRRVLAVLGAAAEPPTAHRLAAELGLHVTTVRFHLDQLEQAGLVAGRPVREGGRGRPALHYRATGLGAGHTREDMIDALAGVLAGDRSPDGLLTAGRRWAGELAAAGEAPTSGEPGEAITEVFSRLGFDPELDGDRVLLRDCPFRAAARRHPDVVCRVHLGLAQGLAEQAAGPEGAAVGLTPFVRPDLCVFTLAGTVPATDPARSAP